jgi:hypothetical protein
MANAEFLDGDSGLGLSMDEVRSTARRQFVASVFVGIVIAVAAAFMALRPAHQDFAGAAPQKYAGVQQPSFATPAGQRLAGLRQPAIELP